MNTPVLRRLKNSVPFSQRLNDFIIKRCENLKFKATSEDEFDSFEHFRDTTKSLGYMLISNQFCDNNIFGSAGVNIMFRAWHDSIHLDMNEGFGYMEEARVCFAQIAELPNDWHFEKQLLIAEIIGQAAYHEKTGGSFVPNQREFTINFLEAGKI